MKTAEKRVPVKHDILSVRNLISPYAHHTPVLTSASLDKMFSSSLFFKCENFQKAGAFKFRGAVNAILSMGKPASDIAVATHSSGNHAQALALAARIKGIPAHIVMPENAPKVKVEAVRSYGGKIIFCEPTLKAREETLAKVIDQTGAFEIHPYNDYRIIAGQATATAELLEQVSNPDTVLVPVGGGGLLSGAILATQYFSPHTSIIAAEPLMANDAWQSYKSGKFIPSSNPVTIADGLKTSLGTLTYPIIMNGITDILTVSEENIIKAMRLIWERMKIVVEPSAAVPLGAIIEHNEVFRDKRVGIIISGGNVDFGRQLFSD